MREVYIVSAIRSPIGRFGGSLSELSPSDLGAHVMQAVIAQANLPPDALDLYIMGNVLRGGHGQLLPRQAALKAGIPATVNGYAIDMVCASGMMSVINAITAIRSGDADIVLAGGMESMSQTGFFLSHRARWGYKTLIGSPESLVDLMLQDGLSDPITGESMGIQTERVAAKYGLSRKDLDEVALWSHQRAVEATHKGVFQEEIAPIEIKSKLINQDEGIRPDTTSETLARLRPVFDPNGILTAGNSSQISDGAAALILASQEAIERSGLSAIAKISGTTWTSGEPWQFSQAPIDAIQTLLNNLEKTVGDIGLFENNEAFAVSSVVLNQTLGIPYERLNINGGAIALGHPIGASGARILVTLIHALKQQDQTSGVASICHGTGGATAIAIERI
jgi:acetyl-CoA C-acetyltransferase